MNRDNNLTTKTIFSLYSDGYTMQYIGEVLHITRQAVEFRLKAKKNKENYYLAMMKRLNAKAKNDNIDLLKLITQL